MSVERKRLGDIINLKRGYDLPSYDREDGIYPVFSSSGISGYHSQYKVDGEGVIIGRYGTLGEPYYINGKYWPHNTSLYITDFKGNVPKYIYYLLKCLGEIKTSDKSAVPGVNRNELHEMVVPCVPREDQKKIAAVLSALDAKIELNNRINAELERLAKTIYDYWFVQFDFPYDFDRSQPDEHGKPYKSSGGEMVWSDVLDRSIPAGWEVGILNELIELHYGKGLKTEARTGCGSPVIGSSGIIGYHSEFLVEGPGIVIGRKGTIGAITYLHENFYPIDTTYYVKPIKPIKFFFLYFLLRTLGLERMNSDSAVPGLNRNFALRSTICLPQLKLIQQFESFVTPLFQKKENNDIQNQQLTQLRDWLLPMLMNGQVRVK
jgi:type I restriction enzyme, S subunit